RLSTRLPHEDPVRDSEDGRSLVVGRDTDRTGDRPRVPAARVVKDEVVEAARRLAVDLGNQATVAGIDAEDLELAVAGEDQDALDFLALHRAVQRGNGDGGWAGDGTVLSLAVDDHRDHGHFRIAGAQVDAGHIVAGGGGRPNGEVEAGDARRVPGSGLGEGRLEARRDD